MSVSAHHGVARSHISGFAAAAAAIDNAKDWDPGTSLSVRGGGTIFNEGDLAQSVYRVKSGSVRLCKLLSDGRRQIANFHYAGDFFGFEPGAERIFTAEAISPSVLICYPRARLDRLAQGSTDMQKALWQIISYGLRTAQNHALTLGRQRAIERLASFFLALSERTGAKQGEVFPIPMNRQDLADYLGLTIETVSRTFAEMRRQHFIDTPGRSQLVIHNLAGLRELADALG